MKVTVLGAGGWGTALAKLLHEAGHQITLWGHDSAQLEEVRRSGVNTKYLPGIALPAGWVYETDVERSSDGADCIVIATPSKAFREVAERLEQYRGPVVSVTKGIEFGTGLTMSGILAEVAPEAQPAVLSGPTLALEVAKGVPSAIVAASREPVVLRMVQELFHRPAFRVYTSADVVGVELGGALKNVIAIGAGACDGLGFGDNAKAALVTRAIAEIRRLGTACGAMPDTFAGLSGLGDLMVTCFSKLSRNRAFGEKLGRGEKLAEVLAGSQTVAEGYPTARSAYHLARQKNVVTPIIDEAHAMLYEGKNLRQALHDLISRESKAED